MVERYIWDEDYQRHEKVDGGEWVGEAPVVLAADYDAEVGRLKARVNSLLESVRAAHEGYDKTCGCHICTSPDETEAKPNG